MEHKRVGKVYLVGAGPGDPGLITVKGRNLLSRADVVVYDRLANTRLLQYVNETVELIRCGKRAGQHDIPQEEINKILVEQAKMGKMVVRLKGGDPVVFGRGGEEAEFCVKHQVDFEFVPGVTSGAAVPIYAGIPITHRDFSSSVAFITGHRKMNGTLDINWESLSNGVDTLVFFMGLTNLAFITEQLLLHGRPSDTPIALIRWGTVGKQFTLTGTLGNIAEKVQESNIMPPVIIVVGENVKLRETLSWYEKKPLFGMDVLIPLADHYPSKIEQWIEEQIEEEGGEVLRLSLTKNIALLDKNQSDFIKDVLSRIESFQWIVFSDVQTVLYFFRQLKELSIDIRSASAKLVALDDDTHDTLVGKGFTGTLQHAKWQDLVGQTDKALFLRSPIRESLKCSLSKEELLFKEELRIYDQVIQEENKSRIIQRLMEKSIDMIVFANGLSINNFVHVLESQDLLSLLSGVKIVCIGQETEDLAIKFGMSVSLRIPKDFIGKYGIRELFQITNLVASKE